MVADDELGWAATVQRSRRDECQRSRALEVEGLELLREPLRKDFEMSQLKLRRNPMQGSAHVTEGSGYKGLDFGGSAKQRAPALPFRQDFSRLESVLSEL